MNNTQFGNDSNYSKSNGEKIATNSSRVTVLALDGLTRNTLATTLSSKFFPSDHQEVRKILCNTNFCSDVALTSRDTYVILFENIMIWWTIQCTILTGRFRFHTETRINSLPCHRQFSFSPTGLCNHTTKQSGQEDRQTKFTDAVSGGLYEEGIFKSVLRNRRNDDSFFD